MLNFPYVIKDIASRTILVPRVVVLQGHLSPIPNPNNLLGKQCNYQITKPLLDTLVQGDGLVHAKGSSKPENKGRIRGRSSLKPCWAQSKHKAATTQ